MTTAELIISFLLILARVGGLIAAFPMFSRDHIPMQVKAGMAVALTWFWFGIRPLDLFGAQAGKEGLDTVSLTISFVREIGIGAFLGTIAGWFIIPARIAGFYIGQEIGLTMGQILDPTGKESSSEVARIFEVIAILLFFTLNLHHWLLLALHHSFDFINQSTDWMNTPAECLTVIVNNLVEYGLVIAGPVAIGLVVVNCMVLYLNKAAPALNLMTIGAPLRLISGFILLVMFWPILVHNIEHSFNQMDADFLVFLSGFHN